MSKDTNVLGRWNMEGVIRWVDERIYKKRVKSEFKRIKLQIETRNKTRETEEIR